MTSPPLPDEDFEYVPKDRLVRLTQENEVLQDIVRRQAQDARLLEDHQWMEGLQEVLKQSGYIPPHNPYA